MRADSGVLKMVRKDPAVGDAGTDGETQFRLDRPDGSFRIDTPLCYEPWAMNEFEWLWEHRIPRGRVTVIEGVAGAGKSLVALDLAARYSRGAGWPDETGSAANGGNAKPAGDVLLICGQDEDDDTFRRLKDLGAQIPRIHQIGGVTTRESTARHSEERPVTLPLDLPVLQQKLVEYPSVGLIVIDPLSDCCSSPRELETALRKLNEWAAFVGVSIIVTVPAYCRFDAQSRLRVSSRWRTDMARCVWCVVADPDDPARRLFVPRRMNFCEEPPGLEFRVQRGRVVWDPHSRIDPNDPLGLNTAVESCLAEVMRDGCQSVKDVFRLGGQCGFSARQLRSAAKRLGIESRKGQGFGSDGGWVWYAARESGEEKVESRDGDGMDVENAKTPESLEKLREIREVEVFSDTLNGSAIPERRSLESSTTSSAQSVPIESVPAMSLAANPQAEQPLLDAKIPESLEISHEMPTARRETNSTHVNCLHRERRDRRQERKRKRRERARHR